MFDVKSLLQKNAATRGTGMILIVTFLVSTMLLMVSIQMMSGTTQSNLLKASRDSIEMDQLLDYAMNDWRSQIVWHLNAGWFPDEWWGWSNDIWSFNSAGCVDWGCDDQVKGSYDGSILSVKGNAYTLKVVVHLGNVTASRTRTYELNPFSCYGLEDAVRYGNLLSVPDEKWQFYMRADCPYGNRNAWEDIETATAGNGSSGGTCSTAITRLYDPPANTPSPGDLQLLDVTNGCTVKVNTVNTTDYYGDIFFRNINGATILAPSERDRYMHIADLRSSLAATNITTSGSRPTTILINTLVKGANALNITTGNSWDQVHIGSITGSPSVNMGDGDDRVLVNNTWTGGTITLGDGSDRVLLRAMSGGTINGTVATSWYSKAIFVSSMTGGTINGSPGWDTISCGRSVSGTSCTAIGAVTINGGDGGDYIYLDNVVGAGANINAGLGYNIIYMKGQSGGAVNAGTSGDGKNIVILAGNRTGGTLTASGPDNLLLVKTGAAIGPGVTGFSKTIYY